MKKIILSFIAALGLADNQLQPLPGLLFLGFTADSSFVELSGSSLRRSVSLSEEALREAAEARGVSIARHRADLRRQYRTMLAALEASAGP